MQTTNQSGISNVAKIPLEFSRLQLQRLSTAPHIPIALRGPVEAVDDDTTEIEIPDDAELLSRLFPSTWGQPLVKLVPCSEQRNWNSHEPLRVGIVLSGGQAPGGHNVIAGVFDYVKRCNPNSQLFGFLMGPSGIFEHRYEEITDSLMNSYRNLGGFDMILSGRHKIETQEQKLASIHVARKLDLHGIVVVGGDDSNTNAAVLAEYFRANDSPTKVVGVPKTIDGDLKNKYIETSFGFDTAVKTYAEFIGNLSTDIATSRKYYHFVRLMGRAASNITLQCALLTRPNYTLIGEEVQARNLSLSDIINDLVDMIVVRQDMKKDYGIVLVPEGLIEFIPEVGRLISEINSIVAREEFNETFLTPASATVYASLPASIRSQLLLDRDPHGNVQVSRIATERLLILMVKARLMELGRANTFIPRSHFFGYEGRSGMPTVFDSNYCYALGLTAGALIDAQKTGYIATVQGLAGPTDDWLPGGCPLPLMMNIEMRKGQPVPVIKKYLVEIEKEPFISLKKARESWKTADLYSSPGPVQFEGPCADRVNFSIRNPTMEELLPEREFGFERKKGRNFFPKSLSQLSPLQRERLTAPISVPKLLFDRNACLISGRKYQVTDPQTEASIGRSFPLQCQSNRSMLFKLCRAPEVDISMTALRVGVLLNGQQSPGCANVLVGLWERLRLESRCGKLFGFLGGVVGLMADPPLYIEISREDLELSRNQGGFELLGREKESEILLVTAQGLEATRRTCAALKLDGLVLIGGKYTLTDVAVLTEDFLRREISTRIIGIPATQNNNIDSSIVECSLGFDSASKCYNYLIGNLNTDGASCAKYWLFVRLMGASKSQIAVESALSTHPNIVLVSEAYAAGDKTLDDVVLDIADTVVSRASRGLGFGTVVIPEGLISSLPQFRQLIHELKTLFANLDTNSALSAVQSLVAMDDVADKIGLSPWSRAVLRALPEYFRQQLVQPRSLGSLELTKVATEELLADMVAAELKKRERLGKCSKVNFVPLCFYFGYQGRSSLPSKFDCSLGMAHGALAALCVKSQLAGYVTCFRGLAASPEEWIPLAYPVTALLRLQGSAETDLYPLKVPMVPSSMVRLAGPVYHKLVDSQIKWENVDHYANPGPIQFEGPASTAITRTLDVEHKKYLDMLSRVHKYIEYIRRICGSGASETLLQTSVASLSVLNRLNRPE